MLLQYSVDRDWIASHVAIHSTVPYLWAFSLIALIALIDFVARTAFITHLDPTQHLAAITLFSVLCFLLSALLFPSLPFNTPPALTTTTTTARLPTYLPPSLFLVPSVKRSTTFASHLKVPTTPYLTFHPSVRRRARFLSPPASLLLHSSSSHQPQRCRLSIGVADTTLYLSCCSSLLHTSAALSLQFPLAPCELDD